MNTILILFVLLSLSNALVIPTTTSVRRSTREGRWNIGAASFSEDSSSPSSRPNEELLLKVREELVQKYLDQGASRSKAEKEVDYFLSDDRSQDYLEMREYALTQKDDGLGIDLFLALQFVGAFVIGFLGHALSNDGGASFW